MPLKGWVVLTKREQTVTFLLQEVCTITEIPLSSLSEQTQLIGSSAVLSSLRLVELLLALEEFAEDTLKLRFDWSSDSAMSEARSSFRTIGSLADHIVRLKAD